MSSISTECRRSSPHGRAKVVRARRPWGLARICWLPSFRHVTDFIRSRSSFGSCITISLCRCYSRTHAQKLWNPFYLLELHCENLRYLRAPKQPSTPQIVPIFLIAELTSSFSSIHFQPDCPKAIYHASQSRFLRRNLTDWSMKKTCQVTSRSITSALMLSSFSALMRAGSDMAGAFKYWWLLCLLRTIVVWGIKPRDGELQHNMSLFRGQGGFAWASPLLYSSQTSSDIYRNQYLLIHGPITLV